MLTSDQHGSIVLPQATGRANEAANALVQTGEMLAGAPETTGATAVLASAPNQVASLVEMSTQSKIIQSEYFSGMLFQDRETKRYFWLWGELPTWLMAVDRCTGETLLTLWNADK